MAGGALWLLTAVAPAAQAHPLGNFSINHYTGLTLHPDRLDALAVTDTAEIPTLQDAPRVDLDGNGTADDRERAAWAGARCADAASKLTVTTPRRLTFTVSSATFDYLSGQAGLRTSRLECRLTAPLDLAGGPVTLHVETGADATRVGWNEITARGEGTHLQRSTVPVTSSSDELRDYPRDLLSTPRGDTRADLTAALGADTDAAAATGSAPRPGGGLTARMEALSRQLTSLAGTKRLTVPVGVLAVVLSIVLGAGHALLPGHGKTVMAAYLAGRRGRTRDAITVGATVTLTHTAGVLVIGLCLTTFSWLAGDTVLAWLGVTSGALVALVGAGLLTDAVRRTRRGHRNVATGIPAPPAREPALIGAAGLEPAADGAHSHRPHHHHDHGHPHDQNHDHDADHHGHGHVHRHGLLGHHHTHGPARADAQPFSTRGLIGLGIAGGLVPSPSALVVLLGAVALGRTVFGAALVVAYGLGMAATLTTVGLLLVRLGDRLGHLADRPALRIVRRLAPHAAVLTALLVLAVGLGLMVRSLPPVL
ncbi:high frequency lysogenization protein HflD [Kitasatospora sp. NPDC006697]|uniref:HoxN/HupN/NixA family nickel/cobalt transporter n=1 Tax=Kitasatospora sp. NPDC006697 TaxID=3364020 RepID=UPI0036BC9174